MPLIVGNLEFWVSSVDLPNGRLWADEIAKKLEKSDFGILVN